MPSWLRCPFSLVMFFIYTTNLLPTGCGGVQVTSSDPPTIQRAAGERATLSCKYKTDPSDTGELDIEWSVVSPDSTQKDQLLISYTGGSKYLHSTLALAQGLEFAADDPSTGDASLSIAQLSPVHTSTYQCKVRKSPGVDMLKMSLVVMVKPSVPRCSVRGSEIVGESVSLHCESTEGSPPLIYMWKRGRGGPTPTTDTQSGVTGELTISNHSQIFAGLYVCMVTNAVGEASCKVLLKAEKPPNRAGVIAGIVVGSLLLVILLLLFIALLICKLSARPRYEKELSNDIREDAPPPRSRPASRGTSQGASLRPEVVYSYVGEAAPSPFDRQPIHTSSQRSSANYTPVRYDSKYGYAV